ncbi:MAG: cytochrome c3 family protein [Anaerolineales bacterium]|uniref:Cytochrome c3 family protein n=1 Tax=Candidatus Desulfolinea nitratireducens TaxID=2841698 RepID=A0A8J6NJJ4_9CHLR|nr:cytochrome c3 family protein [Candidatus Desulfolinea nitratireducens]
MKRAFSAIKKFFYPASDASRWVKIMPYLVLSILFLLMVITSTYTWEYTNSTEFCGSACHGIHPAENIAYEASPHAEVKCVECHIGRAFVGNQITRKLGDIQHVVAAVSKNYEYPLHVKTLRPAREVCERCHNPDKFSDDSQRVIYHYSPDKENTLYRTYLILKTGGGTVREGLGKGIHWHTQNQVLYYPTDGSEQEIPYVKVIYPESGIVSEYVDISSDFDPYSIDEAELKEMDCITCHNRISHTIHQPENAIDLAISRGVISVNIPGIRQNAVRLLSKPYESQDAALREMDTLGNYYRDTYAEFYQENLESVDQAIGVIKEIYTQSIFPEQKVDWDTYASNMGHMNDPGCFRCHDGKHFDFGGFAVRIECNLCHAVPVIAGPDDLVTEINISHEQQPNSHHNANWIALHRYMYDEEDENETCSECHDVTNFGEANNTSFCSNSACHGQDWEGVNFEIVDNSEIFEKLVQQLPHFPKTLDLYETFVTPSLDTVHWQEVEDLVCEDCHVDWPPVGPPPNDICLECHGETQEGFEELTAVYEPNPHDGHYGEDTTCSYCHINFGSDEIPESCSYCHVMEGYELIEGVTSSE